MELSEHLTHIEENVRELKTDMKENVRELKTDMKEALKSLAKIEGSLPHFATMEEVEQAKHEATKGKYGAIAGAAAFLVAVGSTVSRFFL